MKYFSTYVRSLNILWSDEKLLVIFLVISCVCVGVIQIFEPVLFGQVIDKLSTQNGVQKVLVLWGLIGVLNIISSVFMAVMSDRLAHRQRLNTLDQVFERVIALPVSYHTEQGSGRVVHAILKGTDQLFTFWLALIREQLASIIGIAFLVPVALTMDLRMAGLLFFLAIIYLVANFTIVKKTHHRQEQVERYHQNLFARVGDVIGNVTVVQSYTRFLEEVKALQNIEAQVLSAQYPILTWWGILSVITRISATLTMVAILALGSWLVMKKELSVGEVVAFASFSLLLISRLEQISGFVSRSMTQAPALQTFFNLLDQSGVTEDSPNARTFSSVRGEVEFKDVTFHYKNSNYGVENLNFAAKAGQTIALVGASGSGKTTTLALLQRLFDPQSGSITIDGEDVRHFTMSSLRHLVATVFQESGLFNRSISENIRVGRPSATDQEVEDAARQADAHEFISAKPNGYNFIIGERGAALSGGEKQRVAIARAILKNAPLLIFDEATSALDNQTEKRIQNAIANLRAQQKTTFIIAHRLSTVITADQILVFEKGRIIESGTFDELKNKNGLFADLVRAGELTPTRNLGAVHAT